MSNKSGIEWIRNDDGSDGLTVNPVIGCERISPGCGGGYIRGPNGEHGGCWAEHLVSTRMSKNPKLPMYKDLARPGGGWSGIVKLVPERLKDLVAIGRRRKPTRVFVCDMSDMFHDDVPFDFIAAIWSAMASAPESLFYVLTKRPKRALVFRAWIAKHGFYARCPWPLPNVAFGVTCEDSRFGVPRLELGRQFPARWHFASVEPLLEDLGSDVDFTGYDLVIEGGEAGPGARPHDLAWARNVRDAAKRAGARFFMKQAGDHVLLDGKRLDMRKKGNDLTVLPEDLRIRENLPMPGGAK